ncbi:GDSL-type esterase/lipase family protein [Klebsiella grimontii]
MAFNPELGSSSPAVLLDNAERLDNLVNSDALTVPDRAGVDLDTWRGFMAKNDEVRQNLIPLSRQYMTLAAAQADIANIPEGSATYVRSPSDKALALEVINNGGVLEPTYRALPSQAAVDDVNKIASGIERRTSGVKVVNYGDGRFVWADINSRQSMAIELNGDKVLYGKTKANALTVTESMDMGNTQTIPSDGSAYVNGWGGKNYRIAFGLRTDRRTVDLHGVPLTTQRGALPNDVFTIGDSIPAYGISSSQPNATGTLYPPLTNAQSWVTWAMLMTNGRYSYVGTSATPGFTAAQVLATHVPKAIAAKPSFCLVMCGRNDVVKGIDIESETLPAMTNIFRQLRFAGIIPVVCSMSAQSGNTDAQNLARYKINDFCRQYAAKYGLPFVDLHAATTDPLTGGWVAGYNQDVSHPTPLGAKVMGIAVATAMAEWQAPTTPQKAESVTTPASSNNILTNPLFVDSSAGLPSDWSADVAGSVSITQESNIKGNVWTVTGSASPYPRYFRTVTVEPGKKYGFGFMVKVSGTGAVPSWMSCYAKSGNSLNDSAGDVYFGGIRGWRLTTDWGYYYFESVIPSGIKQMTIIVQAQSGSVSLAQMGVFTITDTTGL